jgi:haloacetate dehalogenase
MTDDRRSGPTADRLMDRRAASDSRSADEAVRSPDRRRVLRTASALVAGATLAHSLGHAAHAQDARPAPAAPAAGEPLEIPGFERARVKTSDGTTIQAAVSKTGGKLPGLLLLHGAPLTHYTWRDVAPELAKRFTVVAADLRGYGDSDQPQGLPDHSNYSKRAMAQDQVDVMKHFGFDSFAVVGQDRGGRVAHRMALDHPKAVTKLVLIDIVPTYYLYTHVTLDFVRAYFHWFNFLQASPIPENQLLALAPGGLSPGLPEYRRRNATPAGVHAMCEDYRAAASIDLQHDKVDLDKKIACPVNTLWADGGAMAKLYDVLAIWRERARNVIGKGMPGGHNMQEGAPTELLAELQRFLSA